MYHRQHSTLILHKKILLLFIHSINLLMCLFSSNIYPHLSTLPWKSTFSVTTQHILHVEPMLGFIQAQYYFNFVSTYCVCFGRSFILCYNGLFAKHLMYFSILLLLITQMLFTKRHKRMKTLHPFLFLEYKNK